MRLIDADALWKAITTRFDYGAALDEILNVLDSMPTISPDEVRGVGKWIECIDYDGDGYYECSVCHTPFTLIDGTTPDLNDFHYCPNCGAKLEVTSDAMP